MSWRTIASQDEVLEALRTALGEEFLAVIPEEALTRLAQAAREHHYRRGEPIFHEDDVPGDMYVIREGHVKHVIASSIGSEFTHHLSKPGEFFGNLTADRYGGTAIALTDSRMFAFDRGRFVELLTLAKDVDIFHLLRMHRQWTQAGRRLETIHRLVFQTVPMRLANILLDVAEPERDTEELVIPDYLNQAELAHLIGTTRESVNAALRHFAGNGWIETDGRRIAIVDPEALRRTIQ